MTSGRGSTFTSPTHAGTLKYEFRVQPGARPSDVRLDNAGARGLSIDDSGALLIDTDLGVLHNTALALVSGDETARRIFISPASSS